MEYIAYLHKEKKSDYGVSFPDFPGCITAGKTLEEARRNASAALTLHIEGMLEDGEEIPEASLLDNLSRDPALKDAVAFLVDINVSDKVQRFNITARNKHSAFQVYFSHFLINWVNSGNLSIGIISSGDNLSTS